MKEMRKKTRNAKQQQQQQKKALYWGRENTMWKKNIRKDLKEGSDPHKWETREQECKESTKLIPASYSNPAQTTSGHTIIFSILCQSAATVGIGAPQGAHFRTRDTAVESKHQIHWNQIQCWIQIHGTIYPGEAMS